MTSDSPHAGCCVCSRHSNFTDDNDAFRSQVAVCWSETQRLLFEANSSADRAVPFAANCFNLVSSIWAQITLYNMQMTLPEGGDQEAGAAQPSVRSSQNRAGAETSTRVEEPFLGGYTARACVCVCVRSRNTFIEVPPATVRATEYIVYYRAFPSMHCTY